MKFIFNKKISSFILVNLVLLLLSTSLVIAAPEYTIRMHHGIPVNHYLAIGNALFAEKVAEKTDGRVEVQIFPAAQLYNDTNSVQAVLTGAIESVWNYDHKWFTVIPAIGGMGAPSNSLTHLEFPESVRLVEEMQARFYEGEGPGAFLDEKFQEKGLKIIYFQFWTDENGFSSKGKPIISPEDLKGVKIRVYTDGEAKMYHSLGAQPVSLTGAELYEALARGTIDAAPITPTHLVDRKLKEVVDYHTYPQVPYNCIGLLAINLNYWNKLPSDLQDLILEAGEEADKERWGILEENQQNNYESMMQEGKIEFIKFTPEQLNDWINIMIPFKKEATIELGEDAIEMWNRCQALKEELGMDHYGYIEE
jgi:C4-dicarboxylate-binding protein DctP